MQDVIDFLLKIFRLLHHLFALLRDILNMG